VTTPDLLAPDFYADIDGMHEAFRAMRAKGPVWRDEKNALWAVVGHPTLLDVERNAEVFSSQGSYRSRVAPQEEDMIAKDDPAHREQRSLVSSGFTPKAVQRLERSIDAVVQDLVDGFIDQGEVEVVDDLAAPLPARLTAQLLGFDDDQADSVRSWSERLMRIDQLEDDPSVMMGMMTAIQEFATELGPLVEDRRRAPRDDLVSIWANAELGGCPMEPSVFVQETGLFISGGAETTRTVIARGLYELTRHPDAWEAMAESEAIPTAVEEIIRWVTPLNNMFRSVTRDAEIAGTAVHEGDRVVLLYPSANRDESVFDDPYTFDIARHPNPQVAFGFGPHFCLGAPLARLELRMLFSHLARRITNLQVVTEPDIEPNIFVGAVRSLRLSFDRR
jgi:cytochrome P450 family 142 subfamily A polypeptide 1